MRSYSEQEMYRVLGKEMQVSETVEERLEQTYRQIRAQEKKKPRGRKLWYGAAGTAAAMLAAGVFCVSNPALAAQIPLIGHLFEQLGGDVSYPGDYSGVGAPLAAETETDAGAGQEALMETNGAQAAYTQTALAETNGEQAAYTQTALAETNGEQAAYTQTAGGMTVTLSEVYCNEVALYLTMQLKTEEPMAGCLATWDDGSPILSLNGQLQFGYSDTPALLETGELSGTLVDDCTYLGMYRLELAESLKDYTDFYKAVEEAGEVYDAQTFAEYGDLIHVQELPEQFDVSISIDRIIGQRKNPVSIYEAAGVEAPTQETIDQMSDEEFHAWQAELLEQVPDYADYPSKYQNYWYDGPFAFDLNVSVDHDRTVTVPVDKGVEGGFWISSVTRTPFELLVDYSNPSGQNAILQVLDADGRRMTTGLRGGRDSMLSADGHDVSRIDVYWVAWDDFEGQKIKGSYFDEHEMNEEGQTLKEVLDNCSLYHCEVALE